MNINNLGNTVLAQQAGQVEENSGFDVMPRGDYILKLVDLNGKDLKSTTGRLLEAVFEVAQENGQYAGRKIWHNFTFDHPNETTVRIAIGQMKTFCRLTRGALNDNEQFTINHVVEGLGVPFVATLRVKEDRNEIASFKAPYDTYNPQGHQQQGVAQQAPNFAQQQQAPQQGFAQQQFKKP